MKWKTQNGEKIDITEITDGHLLNAISYLKRGAKYYKDIMLFDAYMEDQHSDSDGVSACARSAISQAENMEEEEILEDIGYFELLKEKKRRNLI